MTFSPFPNVLHPFYILTHSHFFVDQTTSEENTMKPPMLWLTLCLLLSVVAPAANANEKGEVKAIVNKATKAVGGEDNLLRLFRWKEHYYFGESKTGTLRDPILQPPDH